MGMGAVESEISKAFLVLESGERHPFYYALDAIAFPMRVPIAGGSLQVRVSFDMSRDDFIRSPTLRFGFGVFGPENELRATGFSEFFRDEREFEWEASGDLPCTALEMITAQMKSLCTTLCEIARMVREQLDVN